MKLLNVGKNSINMEIGFDELGILHFALYDYLVKVEGRSKQKCPNEHREKRALKVIDKITSMVETVNSLI